MILHQLYVIFGYPYGIVTGNLLAAVIGLAAGFIFRDRLMKRFVELHHKHKTAHLARLAAEKEDDASG